MEIAGIIFVVVAISFSGGQAGPHGHSHSHPASAKEIWRITANLFSGRDDNPSWDITEDMRKQNGNIGVLAQALSAYTHDKRNIGTTLNTTTGVYKGLSFTHILDGKAQETRDLPACTLPLEKALLHYTAPKNMNAYYRGIINCTLKACETPTESPKDCYNKAKQ